MNNNNAWFSMNNPTSKKYCPIKMLHVDNYILVITNVIIIKLDITTKQIVDDDWFSELKLPLKYETMTVDIQNCLYDSVNDVFYVLDPKKIIVLDKNGNLLNNLVYNFRTSLEFENFTFDKDNFYLLDSTNSLSIISRSNLKSDDFANIDLSYNLIQDFQLNEKYKTTSITDDDDYLFVSIYNIDTQRAIKKQFNLTENSFYTNTIDNNISNTIINDPAYSNFRTGSICRINKTTKEIQHNWCCNLIAPFKIKVFNSLIYVIDYVGAINIVDKQTGIIKQNCIINKGMNDIVIVGSDIYLSTWVNCSIIKLVDYNNNIIG
jgi:hypothetical protein